MVDTLLQSNRRTLDPSLSDGTPLGTFVLGTHVLGPYSRVIVTEGFTQVLITTFYYGLADSGPVVGSETHTRFGAQAVVESGTITSVDAYAVITTKPVSDTDTMSVSESFSGYRAASLVDTDTFTSVETSAIAISQTYTDSGSVSASESRSGAAAASLSDARTLTYTRTYVGKRTSVGADSGTLTVLSETISTASTMNIPRTEPIVYGETLNIKQDEKMTASDGQFLVVIESPSLFTTLTFSDTGTIGVSETRNFAGFVSLNDTQLLSRTEELTSLSTFYVTYADSDTITITETRSLYGQAHYTSSEFLDLIYSGHHVYTQMPRNDAATLSGAETMIPATVSQRADSGTLGATEAGTFVVLTEYVPITFIQEVIVEQGEEYIAMMLHEDEDGVPSIVREVVDDMSIIQTMPENVPALIITEPENPIGISREIDQEPVFERLALPLPATFTRMAVPGGITRTNTTIPTAITIVHTFEGEL